jgi:altronate hydrolase
MTTATTQTLKRHPNDDVVIATSSIARGASVEEVGRQILDEVLAVASGKRTKSEIAGVGEAEFAPWVKGPVL